ncbi:MAG: hypothetical protein Q7T68_01840 [Sphingopyxis sp.]|nr:hypothetical protein [Sphingopyxis sp.]
MRTFYRWTAILGLTLASTAATGAEALQDRKYRTVWDIQAARPPAGTQTIAAGKPVLEQRLLPIGLAAADEDILSDSGKVLAEKGTQFFQLRVAAGKTYCVANVPRPSAWRSVMLGGGNLQLCLVDADADGIFDGHFNGGNPMKGVPFIEGKQPKSPKPLRSGRYSALPVENFTLNYTVRIVAETIQPATTGKPSIRYRIDFGDEAVREKLSGAIAGTLGDTGILGAGWTVLETTDGAMTIEISGTMPAQPFAAYQTRIYR